MGLLDILKQYAGDSTPPHADVNGHFNEVAQAASPADLGNGIAAAFRSDATPPFGQLVGGLFGNSSSQQQAGMLNQLIQGLGTGGLASAAGGVLGKIFGNGAAPATITPEQASRLSPDDVASIAAQAEKRDPSIVDRMGQFYAEHPTLVQTLGAAALSIVIRNVSRRQ